MFTASGAFDKVDCQIEGLGRIDEIKELYIAHTASAIEDAGLVANINDDQEQANALEDGEYQAVFKTDSSMFKVNEAYDDMGILTVKDGVMTIHVSLQSENIVNLFVGLSEDAQKDGAFLFLSSSAFYHLHPQYISDETSSYRHSTDL